MLEALVQQGFRLSRPELGTSPGAQNRDAEWPCHRLSVARLPRRRASRRWDHMPATIGAEAPTPIPLHRMFDLDDIQAHYRIGRTRALELVSDPAFLRSVVPGMHRYPAAAVEAYDLAVALAGTVAELATAAPLAPVVITPPAPGRPGPKPKSASTRKAA